MITTLDERTALVLIDLQKGILGNPAVADLVAPVLENAVKLVAAFRKANLPIVVVNVDPRKSTTATLRKDIKQNTAGFNDELLEIAPQIITNPSDIFITKNTWNAFANPALEEALKKLSVTGIVLAGVATSIGVEGTARKANENGYNISFANDAMADMVSEAHANSLKYIFPKLGEVGSTNEIIEKLLSEN